jgi:hypothetical protein
MSKNNKDCRQTSAAREIKKNSPLQIQEDLRDPADSLILNF